MELAKSEADGRGGKYGCVVWEFAEPEQERKQIAYFPSALDEDRLHHNYRIDMFKSLGHRFAEFAEGVVYLPDDHPELKTKDGTPTQVMKPHKVDAPQWAKDEYERQLQQCKTLTEMDARHAPKAHDLPSRPSGS